MIDYDLSDIKVGFTGYYIEGKGGRTDLEGVAHAVNCRCSERSIAFYEAYVSGVKQKTLAEQNGISPTRAGQLVDRVRLCKRRAAKQAQNAFIALPPLHAMYLVECLKRVETAAQEPRPWIP